MIIYLNLPVKNCQILTYLRKYFIVMLYQLLFPITTTYPLFSA